MNSCSSREVVLAWLRQPDYNLRTDYRTGKPDIKGFCEKIYSNFGHLLVPQKRNPARHKGFASVDVDGLSNVQFPEQLRVARGMKAVFEWLNRNIDLLEYKEVPVVVDGKERVDETTGKPVTIRQPVFIDPTDDVNKKNKITKVLSELAHLSHSELLTTEERAAISNIRKVVSKRLL